MQCWYRISSQQFELPENMYLDGVLFSLVLRSEDKQGPNSAEIT